MLNASKFVFVSLLLSFIIGQKFLFADDASESPMLHNGGAVYFQLEKGTFELELFKRDRIGRATRWDSDRELKATLLSPGREVVAIIILPCGGVAEADGSGWAPAMSKRKAITINKAGTYKLLVTPKRDSYFHAIRWGFKSNATAYMIDAGAGHRDSTRNEFIALLGEQPQQQVTFRARENPFTLSIRELDANASSVRLLCVATDRLIQEIDVHGRSVHSIINLPDLDNALLKLMIPSTQAVVSIAEVTTVSREIGPWMPVWTSNSSAWFDVEFQRWLVWPRYQLISDGRSSTISPSFTLQNPHAQTFSISVSASLNGIMIEGSQQMLELAASDKKTLTLELPIEQSSGTFQILFEENFGDWFDSAEVEWDFERGQKSSIDLPFAISPLRHHPQAFGLDPSNQPAREVYFDVNDSPWFLGSEGLMQYDSNAGWLIRIPLQDGQILTSNRVGTDAAGRMYILLRDSSGPVLKVFDPQSSGGMISHLRLPGNLRGRLILQTSSGATVSEYPPVILAYERIGTSPRDPAVIWGVDHRLTAVIPHWQNEELIIQSTVVLSEECIGIADHSGLSSPVGQYSGTTFIVYGETSAADSDDPGVPIIVRAVNRETGDMTDPVRLGYAPPVNDIHNVPSLLIDSIGHLHIILGAHNESFTYTRSEAPLDVSTWAPIVDVASGFQQTYVGAVIDKEDTLHLVSRIWRRGEHFPEDPFDTSLIYQHKRQDSEWSDPIILINPPLPHYSIYYHRLTVSPNGDLYLSWTHWPTWSAYRNELINLGPPSSAFGYLHWRSTDGGNSWNWVMSWD